MLDVKSLAVEGVFMLEDALGMNREALDCLRKEGIGDEGLN